MISLKTPFFQECNVAKLPAIANGEAIPNIDSNQTTFSAVNVSCNHGYAATFPVVTCQDDGQWQDNVSCVFYGKCRYDILPFSLHCIVLV
jgi:hypothetical protein